MKSIEIDQYDPLIKITLKNNMLNIK